MDTPSVVYADGDEASGMATMLGGLLEENLRDYPGRARVASLARGDVVLTASDRDVSVTVSFRGAEVIVTSGPVDGAAVVAGTWLEMAKLCSGQVNPVKALARRELRIEPRGRLDAAAAAGYVLSVPAIFYAQDDPEALAALGRRRRRTAIAVAVVVGAGVTGAMVARRRRRRRSSTRT